MNQDNPHSKLKFSLPASTPIFSKRSYRKVLKNRPNYLQKLEIQRNLSMKGGLEDYKALSAHIKRLSKSYKSIQHLDFVKFPHSKLSYNVQKEMIKSFRRIRKLNYVCASTNFRSIFIDYLYLKYLKSLKSLVLEEPNEGFKTEHRDLKRIPSTFFFDFYGQPSLKIWNGSLSTTLSLRTSSLIYLDTLLLL